MRTSVEKLFHEVVDLPIEARAQYFAEREVDWNTQREVEALVAFDSSISNSLEREIGDVAQRALARMEQQPMLCGPYRLGELLGRGGMGTVYLAQRVDGEVSQEVAVKLLRPGADDPWLRQRFLMERQILATLSHANIARLLDAGHREDGQPYLVMEYVKGKAIGAYTAGFATRSKIKLFLKVCAAVGYLHRNLVVHRDLKPSNILVTCEGEPKLLDFGIAKMLDVAADSTLTVMRILTPDYASPEQVTGGALTTASDIYSLGVVLYELLTDELPHQVTENSPQAKVLAISNGRITPPSKFVPGLSGDLETILMKALRKEPQERYTSVDQFSEDLENYLESRPIRARKGDTWYRTRKFLSRQWLPVGAITLALVGLAGGFLAANHERADAQKRFSQVRKLANKLFDIDAEVRKLAGNTKTRQLIVDTSLEYLRQLSSDVHNDRGLALELGNAYMRVARVQGVSIASNLGQMDQAERNLEVAERFIQFVLAAEPANRTALLRSAQIAHDRMVIARNGGRDDDALAFAIKSAERLEKFNAGIDDKPETPAILTTYLNVADQFVLARRFDEGLGLIRHASDIARSYNHRRYLGNLLWVSADVFRKRGDLDSALKDINESVKSLEPAGNAEQGLIMNYIMALVYQGRILDEEDSINMGRPREAVASLQRAFDISDEHVHKDSKDQNSRGRLAVSGLAMADILRHSDARGALAIYDHTLRHMAEISDNSSFRRFEVSALIGSSYPLRRLGRASEAKQRLDAAFDRLRQIKAYPAEKLKPGSEADVALCALADYEADRGDVLRAIQIDTEVLKKVLAFQPKPDTSLSDAVDVSRLYAALGGLHRRAHQVDLARTFEVRRLDLWRHWNQRLPNNNFVRRQLNAAGWTGQ